MHEHHIDEHLRRLIHLGRDYFRAGDYDRAEPCLAQVVARVKGFPDVFNMLGVIYHDRSRFREAERCFERALELNPNYTEASLNLAVTYNDRGKYDEARAVYEKARESSRKHPRHIDPFVRGKIANMHAELGDVYARSALFREAVREFTEALDLCPDFVDIRTRLGNVYREMGRPRAAADEYARALKKRPDYTPARLALGVTLYSLGRKEEALAHWDKALRDDPENRSAAAYLRMSKRANAPRPGSASDAPEPVSPFEAER